MNRRFTFSLALVAATHLASGCEDSVECVGGGVVKDGVCDCPADKPFRMDTQCWASEEAYAASKHDGGPRDAGGGDAGEGGTSASWNPAKADAAPPDARAPLDAAQDAKTEIAAPGSGEVTSPDASQASMQTSDAGAPPASGDASAVDASADTGSATVADANAMPPAMMPPAMMPTPPACVATTEMCDSADNDCDGMIDEGVKKQCWADADSDGYAGMGAAMTEACACGAMQTERAPMTGQVDCDDASNVKAPNQTEVCGNGVDNDCDGMVDEGCCTPTGYEVCDSKDNNCDGQIDNIYWRQDCDNDGYSKESSAMVAGCTPPNAPAGCAGWRPAPFSDDCDDTDASKNVPSSTGQCVVRRPVGPGDFE